MQQTSQCADDVQGGKVWDVWEGGFEEFRHRSADIHAAVSVSERHLVLSSTIPTFFFCSIPTENCTRPGVVDLGGV